MQLDNLFSGRNIWRYRRLRDSSCPAERRLMLALLSEEMTNAIHPSRRRRLFVGDHTGTFAIPSD
jgi:hypothetical protein